MTTGADSQELYCGDLPSVARPELGRILVSGATGYIGGRLVPELLGRGYRVKVMVRMASPEYQERWSGVEIAVADALTPDTLGRAMEGVHTAYYLIHSLLLGPREFETADIESAINFRNAAERSGVKRIIYLGGLGDHNSRLSAHLRSRMQVAEELKKGFVPVTIFRAAIIIGSGSASYEMIEHLVKSLPVLPVPAWARTLCQPISVRDVVKYLVGAMEKDETAGKSYDIGGPDIMTYEIMLKTLAEMHGLKRVFVPSPVSWVRLFAYLSSLLTPVPLPIAHCLLEGCCNEVICRNDDIRRILPFATASFKEALVRAMSREEQDRVRTRWSDAYPPAHELAIKLRELTPPPRYVKTYSLLTDKAPSSLFRSICSIGGTEGWFNNNWMWKLRGLVDRVLTGVGTSRGRRSRSTLRIDDVIDFWRVEDLKKDEMLLLRAEMKLPGLAWLQFNIEKEGSKNRLSVRAHYQTDSVAGRLYWAVFMPFHIFIFYDLIRQIEKKS